MDTYNQPNGLKKLLKSEAKTSDRFDGAATVTPPKTVVKPVVNAIQILRYLAEPSEVPTATNIARELKIHTSTCFNILRTLVKEGVIGFDPVGKTYSFGLGLLELVRIPSSEQARLTLAAPLMRDFANTYDVTVLLWHRIGNARMILVRTEFSPSDMGIHLRLGFRLPLMSAATGRAMASHIGLSKQEIRAQFNAVRWARPLAFDAFWKDVQESARRGWAVDDGYFTAGILGLAAPIVGDSDPPRYSLGAVAFREQHDAASVKKMGQALHGLSLRLVPAFG